MQQLSSTKIRQVTFIYSDLIKKRKIYIRENDNGNMVLSMNANKYPIIVE